MKELSIEEKAKRYDEAIKKVNDYYEGKTKLYSNVDKTLDCLFPELKESEDEKIRKELIEHIKANKEVGFVLFQKFSPDDVIAWLEKQKVTDDEIIFRPVVGTDIRIAAKQALEKIDIGKKVVLAFNGAYIPVNGKTVGEIDSEYDTWLEKQGQTFTKKDVDNAYLKGVCDAKSELEKHGEQKPAWSEDDEEELDNIIDFLNSPSTAELCPTLRSNAIDWLKTLKKKS